MNSMLTRIRDRAAFMGRVWRLVTPYWRSDQRLSAWALLVAIVALTLGERLSQRPVQQLEPQFYNALEEHDFDTFRQPDALFLRAGRHRHRRRGLPALLDADA